MAASPGNLLVTSSALLLLAIWLWGRRLPRRWFLVALAGVLLVGAPYLVSDLARGISCRPRTA